MRSWPFAGTVIEKHIVVGEMLKDDTEAFVVADLSTVWVDLNLSTKAPRLVRKGQRVVIAANTTMQAEGTVSYISGGVGRDAHGGHARGAAQPERALAPGAVCERNADRQ